jgi:hypothetical protein
MKIVPILDNLKTTPQIISWLKNFMDSKGIRHPFQAHEKPYIVCRVYLEQSSDIALLSNYMPKVEE